MNGVKKQLKEIVAASEIVSRWTQGVVRIGRLMVDEKEIHELQDLACQAGAHIKTIEDDLKSFGRYLPFVKKQMPNMLQKVEIK